MSETIVSTSKLVNQPQSHSQSQPQAQSTPFPALAPTSSRAHFNPDPFPIQLHLHLSRTGTQSHPNHPHHHLHRPPTRNDGFDNNPPPLPSGHEELERRLTRDPDVEKQMGVNDDEIGPPPEGGKEAWCCVGSAFFILFCIFGFITSFGQLKSYYLTHQLSNYSQSEVAWVATIQCFLCFVGSIVSGRYFDAHGARTIVLVGTTVSVAAIIAIAFCTELYQFILAHALFGISGSIMYSPSTAVVGHWFMRRRATAIAIVVCGSGLSGVIYPIALKRLFDEMSFRNAMLIIAAMNAVLMFPSWFFLKARLPPRTPPPLRSLLGPWKDTRYTCLVIGACLVMMNFFSPYYDAPVYVAANNVGGSISSYSIAILQCGSFFGRALSGVMANNLGLWTAFTTVAIGSAISILALWTPCPLSPAGVVVGLVTYGFCSGAWLTLVAASVGSISPTREFGMRLGMLWTLTSLPSLIGPVICGLLVTAEDNKFTHAGIFAGLTLLAGPLVTIAPRIPNATRAWKARIWGSGSSNEIAEEKEVEEGN